MNHTVDLATCNHKENFVFGIYSNTFSKFW